MTHEKGKRRVALGTLAAAVAAAIASTLTAYIALLKLPTELLALSASTEHLTTSASKLREEIRLIAISAKKAKLDALVEAYSALQSSAPHMDSEQLEPLRRAISAIAQDAERWSLLLDQGAGDASTSLIAPRPFPQDDPDVQGTAASLPTHFASAQSTLRSPSSSSLEVSSVGQAVDSDLTAAKARFELSRRDLATALLAELDTDGQDWDDAENIRAQADREAFEKRGLLPASTPKASARYEAGFSKACARLWDAYEAAESALASAAMNERAAAVRAEQEEFRPTFEHSQWMDLRARADLRAEGPSWSGTSIAFSGEAEETLALRLPSLTKSAGYRLKLTVERTSGTGGIKLLFPRADLPDKGLGLYVLGGFGGRTSGLEQLSGEAADKNASTHVGDVLPTARPSDVVLVSTEDEILVEVNGKTILRLDDLHDLALTPSVAKLFREDGRTVYVVAPEGTSARLDAAYARGG